MPLDRRWLLGSGVLLLGAGCLWLLRGSSEPTSPARVAGPVEPLAPTPAAQPDLRRLASEPAAAVHEPAPVAASVTPRPPEVGTPVFRAAWGGAPGQLGRTAANESSPEGPMSFVVDERGRAFVLDQINSRVQVFEGDRLARIVPLPADTIQDIALDGKGGVWALDRLGAGSVAHVTEDGVLSHEIALVGDGVEDAGDVSALEARADGVWVEVRHATLVQIASADGIALADRPVAPGRFADALGGHLRAAKSSFGAAITLQKQGERPEVFAKLRFSMRVGHLTGLESDREGNVHVSLHLFDESPEPPFELLAQQDLVVTLDRAGRELSRVVLPPESGAEESFRRLRVGANGGLYHLGFDSDGATLRRLSP